ncbi:hypothetical protein Bca4012_029917 [Brassica carinata]
MDYSSLFSRSIFSQSYRQDPPSPSRSAVSVQIRRLRSDPPSLSHAAGDENRLQRITIQNLQNVESCSRYTTHLVGNSSTSLDLAGNSSASSDLAGIGQREESEIWGIWALKKLWERERCFRFIG